MSIADDHRLTLVTPQLFAGIMNEESVVCLIMVCGYTEQIASKEVKIHVNANFSKTVHSTSSVQHRVTCSDFLWDCVYY